MIQLLQGDCREVMAGMAEGSVDSIVTDPPYGLTANKKGGSGAASVNLDTPHGRARITTGNGAGGFMGMKWDSDVPPVEVWAECLRVLKPGGYLLAFSGTRTYHRMVCAIEDAGFEIRDQIGWAYGSGFPKSKNLDGDWDGWGTALKPAWEPIVVARKPLIGTVSANVLAHGTGALNIDGCRVGDEVLPAMVAGQAKLGTFERGVMVTPERVGRWPANLIHDGSEEVLAAFPDAPGQMADASSSSSRKTQNVYGAMARGNGRDGEPSADSENAGAVGFKMKPGARRLDSGSAARFFYCAKASKKDRNEGLDGFAAKSDSAHRRTNLETADNPYLRGVTERLNNHPTVKPTDLMAYLCRLVTPPGGRVLDPFLGSGSTGKAAVREGFRFVGIELSPGYIEIARARILAEDPDLALLGSAD